MLADPSGSASESFFINIIFTTPPPLLPLIVSLLFLMNFDFPLHTVGSFPSGHDAPVHGPVFRMFPSGYAVLRVALM
jgi:hypothetical protein